MDVEKKVYIALKFILTRILNTDESCISSFANMFSTQAKQTEGLA